MTYPFKNLVFEGGGVKGIAYVGALDALDSEGILGQIDRVGGTSAGAINAVLMAAGFSLPKTRKVLSELDFNDFKDDSWGALRDLNRLREQFGWHKGDFFRDWIGDQLRSQGLSRNITFLGLYQKTDKALYVYATNISTRFGEVYSPEHTPRMRVVDAVRRSMSIPLFFTAIRDDREDVFVDGGVLNNYPVKLFDRLKYVSVESSVRKTGYYNEVNKKLDLSAENRRAYVYNKETLGFRLDSQSEIGVFRDGDEPQRHDIENLMDYTFELARTILGAQDNQHLHSDDWHRTVYIDTKGVGTTEFDLSDNKKRILVKSGKDSMTAYLKWWNDRQAAVPAINHPLSSA